MIRFRLTLVRLIFIPIISFFLIIFLGNGIRELIVPEWEILIDVPILITVLAWLELVAIVILSIISIYCLIVLYYVLTKFVSTKELDDALHDLKKRD